MEVILVRIYETMRRDIIGKIYSLFMFVFLRDIAKKMSFSLGILEIEFILGYVPLASDRNFNKGIP